MNVFINLNKVFTEAMNHMQDPNDVRWSIGMALQELYGDEWMYKLQQDMVYEFNLRHTPEQKESK